MSSKVSTLIIANSVVELGGFLSHFDKIDNCQSKFAESLDRALLLLTTHSFDYIFFDLNLTDEMKASVIRQIKDKSGSAKLIALCNQYTEYLAIQFLQTGVDEYVDMDSTNKQDLNTLVFDFDQYQSKITANTDLLSRDSIEASKIHMLGQDSHRPLMMVREIIEFMQKNGHNKFQNQQMLYHLNNYTEMLSFLNGSMLDLARLSLGKNSSKMESFLLSQIFEDMGTLVSLRAKERNIDVILDIDSKLHQTYKGNKVRLQQVIYNLLNFTLEYAGAGTLVIKVYPQGPEGTEDIKVSIHSDHSTLTEAKLKDFTDIDIDAADSFISPLGGDDLWYITLKYFLNLWSGNIQTKVNESSQTFDIYLDLKLKQDLFGIKNINYENTLRNNRILIVDRNPLVATHLANYLVQYGAYAVSTHTSSQAIGYINSHSQDPFNLFIIDTQLKMNNGTRLTDEVSQLNLLPYGKILGTGTEVDTDLIHTLWRKGQEFVLKPFRLIEMIQMCKNHDSDIVLGISPAMSSKKPKVSTGKRKAS